MENKMKMDTQTEQSKPQRRELSDQELAQASGGADGFAEPKNKWYEWKRDSQGRVTHWKTEDGPRFQILHYTCPKCGRILHEGTMGFLYCDPCDDWFSKLGANKVIDKESEGCSLSWK